MDSIGSRRAASAHPRHSGWFHRGCLAGEISHLQTHSASQVVLQISTWASLPASRFLPRPKIPRLPRFLRRGSASPWICRVLSAFGTDDMVRRREAQPANRRGHDCAQPFHASQPAPAAHPGDFGDCDYLRGSAARYPAGEEGGLSPAECDRWAGAAAPRVERTAARGAPATSGRVKAAEERSDGPSRSPRAYAVPVPEYDLGRSISIPMRPGLLCEAGSSRASSARAAAAVRCELKVV